MQFIHSSTMAFHSIHSPPFHRCLISMLHVKRLPMPLYIHSHNIPSHTILTPWTTHDMKRSMIGSLVTLTNRLLSLRVVWYGKLQYTVFNFQLIQNSLSLRVPQRIFLGCTMELDGRWLFENMLWNDEKNLICGVYEIETGMLPLLWLITFLAIPSRTWWSNGMPALVAMAICLPSLRHVGIGTLNARCLTEIYEHHAKMRNSTRWEQLWSPLEKHLGNSKNKKKAICLGSESYLSGILQHRLCCWYSFMSHFHDPSVMHVVGWLETCCVLHWDRTRMETRWKYIVLRMEYGMWGCGGEEKSCEEKKGNSWTQCSPVKGT